MDRTTVEDFGKRYTEAWNSGDPARVAAFYADDGSLTVNGGEPAVGRPAVTDVARGFMATFPDLRITLDELGEDAKGTEFHWTLEGTNSGPGGTGKRVRISGFELWRFDAAGLIAESKGHFDAAEYERQLEHGSDE